jgi:crossover junction endodeoxyribonuclease RuvC
MADSVRLIGLDPGLRNTGWGIIDASGNRLRHVANGTVRSDEKDTLAQRLAQIFAGLNDVLDTWRPHSAAVEETFVNKNPSSTLKLGQARGIAMLAPALRGIPVSEYTPNQVKKSVVGVGHADKDQIHMMVGVLLPGVQLTGPDATDALAVALCHAHLVQTGTNISSRVVSAFGGTART